MPSATSPPVELVPQPGHALVTFPAGRLREADAAAVRGALFDLAEAPEGGDVVVDLGGVDYLTSTLLAALVGMHRRLRGRGRALVVRQVRPTLSEVFAVTGLDRVLDLRQASEPGA